MWISHKPNTPYPMLKHTLCGLCTLNRVCMTIHTPSSQHQTKIEPFHVHPLPSTLYSTQPKISMDGTSLRVAIRRTTAHWQCLCFPILGSGTNPNDAKHVWVVLASWPYLPIGILDQTPPACLTASQLYGCSGGGPPGNSLLVDSVRRSLPAPADSQEQILLSARSFRLLGSVRERIRLATAHSIKPPAVDLYGQTGRRTAELTCYRV